jgi:hypothetical protein
MIRDADLTSVFFEARSSSIGPSVDLHALGNTLGRIYAGALAEPVPAEWSALLTSLDDAPRDACDAERA